MVQLRFNTLYQTSYQLAFTMVRCIIIVINHKSHWYKFNIGKSWNRMWYVNFISYCCALCKNQMRCLLSNSVFQLGFCAVWQCCAQKNLTNGKLVNVDAHPKKSDETIMICLTQTRIKMHHASSNRPVKNKLFMDEMIK
jgi:hypothetical protein